MASRGQGGSNSRRGLLEGLSIVVPPRFFHRVCRAGGTSESALGGDTVPAACEAAPVGAPRAGRCPDNTPPLSPPKLSSEPSARPAPTTVTEGESPPGKPFHAGTIPESPADPPSREPPTKEKGLTLPEEAGPATVPMARRRAAAFRTSLS